MLASTDLTIPEFHCSIVQSSNVPFFHHSSFPTFQSSVSDFGFLLEDAPFPPIGPKSNRQSYRSSLERPQFAQFFAFLASLHAWRDEKKFDISRKAVVGQAAGKDRQGVDTEKIFSVFKKGSSRFTVKEYSRQTQSS